MLRGIMEQTLMNAGLQVTVAENGDQAAALLAGGARPDVLLSDIRMSGKLNGKDLARWAKQRYPSMVILLQTGFGDIDDGDFHVLRKPFGPDVLLDAIKDARQRVSQHVADIPYDASTKVRFD